jgi:hypothetical protein
MQNLQASMACYGDSFTFEGPRNEVEIRENWSFSKRKITYNLNVLQVFSWDNIMSIKRGKV